MREKKFPMRVKTIERLQRGANRKILDGAQPILAKILAKDLPASVFSFTKHRKASQTCEFDYFCKLSQLQTISLQELETLFASEVPKLP